MKRTQLYCLQKSHIDCIGHVFQLGEIVHTKRTSNAISIGWINGTFSEQNIRTP